VLWIQIDARDRSPLMLAVGRLGGWSAEQQEPEKETAVEQSISVVSQWSTKRASNAEDEI
jgi:hypothetical protein